MRLLFNRRNRGISWPALLLGRDDGAETITAVKTKDKVAMILLKKWTTARKRLPVSE